jgi:hypothetical protein
VAFVAAATVIGPVAVAAAAAVLLQLIGLVNGLLVGRWCDGYAPGREYISHCRRVWFLVTVYHCVHLCWIMTFID